MSADVIGDSEVATAANRALVVAVKGSVATTGGASVVSTVSAVTRVATNVASVSLKAANANRKALTVHNNSAANLFLKLGAAASITAGAESFTIKMAPNGYYEAPGGWTGAVDGIWDAADAGGEALVTELT